MSAFFYNWSAEVFKHSWDSKGYTFLPGRVYTDFLISDDGVTKIIINAGIAQHFAKHLAVREANKANIDLGLINLVEDLYNKALTQPEVLPLVNGDEKTEPAMSVKPPEEDDSEDESLKKTRGRKPAVAMA